MFEIWGGRLGRKPSQLEGLLTTDCQLIKAVSNTLGPISLKPRVTPPRTGSGANFRILAK
jgi:hypothetical protein